MNPIDVLHINQFKKLDANVEFYCNTLQNHLKESHKHIERPHRHNFYLVVCFTKGSGVHDIDFNTYPVEAGSLFFMSPGQVHSWELSDDIEGYIFFFSQTYFDLYFADLKSKDFPFFGSIAYPRLLQVSSTQFPEIQTQFEQIWKEHLADNVFKNHFIHSLISQILIRASRLFLEQEKLDLKLVSPSYLSTIQSFENLLEAHFIEEKSVVFYADHLKISSKHLNRISQAVLGEKVSEIIAKRSVLEAKRMLTYVDESLVDIAFRLGFTEYPYFTRFFKKHTGFTPSEFVTIQRNQL